MGPIISPVHLERVEGYIETGKSEGAKLLCGGNRLGGALAKGNFLAPTIFDHTSPDMRIVQEEIFGPVLVVQPSRRSRSDAPRQRHGLRIGRRRLHAGRRAKRTA